MAPYLVQLWDLAVENKLEEVPCDDMETALLQFSLWLSEILEGDRSGRLLLKVWNKALDDYSTRVFTKAFMMWPLTS